jgi:hypothetical protein
MVALELFFQWLKFILGQKFLYSSLSCISCTMPLRKLHPNPSYVEGRISSLEPFLIQIYLSFSCDSSQLPIEFRALSQTCRSKRMSLAGQATRWINNNLSSVSVISLIDELPGFSFCAKLDSFISDQFIGTETIVKLNNSNFFWRNSALFVDFD